MTDRPADDVVPAEGAQTVPEAAPRRSTLPDFVDKNEAKRQRKLARIDALNAQRALSGKAPRRRSPWVTMAIGWAVAAVLIGATVWTVHAFVNRDRVTELASVGGLPVSTDADLLAFVQHQQATRPVVGGVDASQMTVTAYGAGDDHAIVWIWPSGGILGDPSLAALVAGDETLDFSEVRQVGSSRCIVGTTDVDDTGTVLCQRTGQDVSVLIQTGWFPDAERTAEMVDEVYAAQPDA